MTKEMSFLTTGTQESKSDSTKSSGVKSETKTGPSLFDSMLSDAQKETSSSPQETQTTKTTPANNAEVKQDRASNNVQSKEETVSKEQAKENEVSSDKSSQNSATVEKTSNKENATNTESKEESKTVASQKQPSLLDKLMMEAQQTIENEKPIESKAQNSSENATSVKENAVSETAKTIQDVVQEIKENASGDTKTSDAVKEVVDSKKEIINAANKSGEEVVVDESKPQEKSKESSKAETTTSVKPDEGNKSGEEVVVDESKLQEKSKEALKDETTASVKPESTEKGEGSLLDRLMQEASKTIDEEKKTSSDTAKANTSVESKNSTMVVENQTAQNTPKTAETTAKVTVDSVANTTTQTPTNVQNSAVTDEVNSTEVKTKDVASKVVPEVVQVKNSDETVEQAQNSKNINSESALKNAETTAESTKTVKQDQVTDLKTATSAATQESVKNEKVAQELAKLNTQPEQPQKVTASVDESKPTEQNKAENKSLIDRLIEQTKQTIEKSSDKNVQAQAASANNAPASKSSSDTLLNSIYLTSQQSALNKASLENAFNAKKVVSEGTSLNDIQKSAKMLDLGLENAQIVKEQDLKSSLKDELLSKLNLSNDVLKYDMKKITENIAQNAKMVSMNNINIAQDVDLNVNSTVAYNIQNRIVGAQQQMGSMMSEVARNMYLNYKPPVTAFRMNLNPGTLGNIAVLIKNEKENGLSISLNMSNQNTLDSFVDNQGALRAALARNFNTDANINLDFNMQEENSQQQASSNGSNESQERQQHGGGRRDSTTDVLNTLHQKAEAELENEPVNYM